jgi:GNAT superfamily N-acetyltransferase
MATSNPPAIVRTATPADVAAIVATMTTAFFDDPMWGPAFPDVERRAAQASEFWRLLVTSSLRYPWTMVTDQVESAAVWIPPGGSELTEDEQSGYEQFLVDITGRAVAEGILAISHQLDAARPSEPHFYLSLLATHQDHRGAGLGMGLLRENLTRVDALGAAAYLESCNPANNERYQSVGFRRRDELIIPSGHVVTTMWRPAR